MGDVSLSSSVVPECSVAEDRLPEEIDASDPVSVLPNKWPCYKKGDNTLCHIYLNVICFKVRENWIKGQVFKETVAQGWRGITRWFGFINVIDNGNWPL